MGNEIVTLIIMGIYLIWFTIVWIVFERRLKIIHRRHVDKCAPFWQKGLEKLDNRLKVIVRATLISLLSISMTTIYLMT